MKWNKTLINRIKTFQGHTINFTNSSLPIFSSRHLTSHTFITLELKTENKRSKIAHILTHSWRTVLISIQFLPYYFLINYLAINYFWITGMGNISADMRILTPQSCDPHWILRKSPNKQKTHVYLLYHNNLPWETLLVLYIISFPKFHCCFRNLFKIHIFLSDVPL